MGAQDKDEGAPDIPPTDVNDVEVPAGVDRRAFVMRSALIGAVSVIAGFAAGLGNVQRVEVLPFHQMGKYKWETLGLDSTLRDTPPPTADACEQACAVFRKAGLDAH